MKWLYSLIRPVLFRFPAERAHHWVMASFSFLMRIPLVRSWIRTKLNFSHPDLRREVFGLNFENPVGLAAGFDKDGKYIEVLSNVGFGFIELGTVTPRPQKGNPRPRLFRLKEDQALINRMGFNNDGVDALVKRLKRIKKKEGLIIGGNIGKNKVTPNEEAVKDYVYCFEQLHPYVDYFVVNVSSPNTPGLRALQNKDSLTEILSALMIRNEEKEQQRPILLKISPDLGKEALKEVIEVVNHLKIAGLICSNTSIRRDHLKTRSEHLNEIGAGGLSGKPIFEDATRMLKQVRQEVSSDLSVVGVGGIHSPETALKKLEEGADLIQVYTGFIYSGPTLVKDILKRLTLS